MAGPNKIDRLPDDLREALDDLLRDPAVSQLEAGRRVNAMLAQTDHPERLDKSTVNRYSQRMEKVGKRLRESRAVADMWIAKLGSTPGGKLGHLVNELVRTMSFDMALTLQEQSAGADPEDLPAMVKMLKELSLAAKHVEQASAENERRQRQIDKQKADAEEQAADLAQKSGLSATKVQDLRRIIAGIAA